MSEQNIVYVLTNRAMPGLVKIGITTDSMESRLRALNSPSGIPLPFEIQYAATVDQAKDVEQALHGAFAPQRTNPKREFFEIEPIQAIGILKLLEKEEMTSSVREDYAEDIKTEDPESMEAVEKFKKMEDVRKIVQEKDIEQEVAKRSRRPNINFHDMDIPNGGELCYIEGNAKAVVCGAKRVRYDGEEMSLSALTQKLRQLDYKPQPTGWWTYNGKNLIEIYDKLYPFVDEDVE